MDGITFYGRYFNVITMNTQSQKVSMAEKIGYNKKAPSKATIAACLTER